MRTPAAFVAPLSHSPVVPPPCARRVCRAVVAPPRRSADQRLSRPARMHVLSRQEKWYGKRGAFDRALLYRATKPPKRNKGRKRKESTASLSFLSWGFLKTFFEKKKNLLCRRFEPTKKHPQSGFFPVRSGGQIRSNGSLLCRRSQKVAGLKKLTCRPQMCSGRFPSR